MDITYMIINLAIPLLIFVISIICLGYLFRKKVRDYFS